MKQLFFSLFLPFACFGQNIHFKDDKIEYKGTVNLALYTKEVIQARLQEALPVAGADGADSLQIHTGDTSLSASVQIKLKTPYHLVRRVNFTLQLTPHTGSYDYKVNEVSVQDGRRAWKMKVIPEKELLEGMEETGAAEIETEVLLNEIDLRIQKLLRLLENRMRVPAADPNKPVPDDKGSSQMTSR